MRVEPTGSRHILATRTGYGTLGRVDEFDSCNTSNAQSASSRPTASTMPTRNVLSCSRSWGAATLRNIVSPKKPGEKTYVELVAALSKHFKPTPSEIVERFKFHSRVQKAGESIATYIRRRTSFVVGILLGVCTLFFFLPIPGFYFLSQLFLRKLPIILNKSAQV